MNESLQIEYDTLVKSIKTIVETWYSEIGNMIFDKDD